jgi:hypothetical protein
MLVVVGGKDPAAGVTARISASAIFDHTPQGYGLREWTGGGAQRND